MHAYVRGMHAQVRSDGMQLRIVLYTAFIACRSTHAMHATTHVCMRACARRIRRSEFKATRRHGGSS